METPGVFFYEFLAGYLWKSTPKISKDVGMKHSFFCFKIWNGSFFWEGNKPCFGIRFGSAGEGWKLLPWNRGDHGRSVQNLGSLFDIQRYINKNAA